jgi:hypothetical protein
MSSGQYIPKTSVQATVRIEANKTYSGVAVGSSIGHAIGGFFGGGSSSAPAEAQQAAATEAQPMDGGLYQSNSTTTWENPACATDVQNFRKCMDENQGNLTICGWYLDQLVRFGTFCFLPWFLDKVNTLLTRNTESLPGCC